MAKLALKKLGFSLAIEPTVDGTEVFSLNTPFKFVTGEPFTVFVEIYGKSIHLFDDGFSLHEVLKSHVNMHYARNWDGIRRVVGIYGVALTPDGVFEHYAPMEKQDEAVSNFIRAMIALDDWLR